MEVVIRFLFASSILLLLLAVALAAFGVVGMVLRWVVRVWSGHGPG